jgi:hypothetical protein
MVMRHIRTDGFVEPCIPIRVGLDRVVDRLGAPVGPPAARHADAGQVTKAMRRVGIAEEEIENFCDEAISGHDHDLLRICGRWVTLAPGWPENRD